MAARFILSQFIRQISVKPSASIAFLKYNNGGSLLKIEESRLSFAQSFCKTSDEVPSEEVDPNAAVVIDAKEASKMRSRIIPVEVSMRYLKSNGYLSTYGEEAVWVKYRRNFKGQFAPETRKTCIRKEKLSTGNPCPICRDEYLVLDYRNIELLKQFISPFNGAILPTKKTGLCQNKQRELLVAISKARDYGLLSFDVPIREYDYSEYHIK